MLGPLDKSTSPAGLPEHLLRNVEGCYAKTSAHAKPEKNRAERTRP